MGVFTRISSDAFDELQLDAGVLLTTYDPTDPFDEPADADIIATTSGGINVVCTPAFSDFAEDVDNAPNNMMEFKHLDSWECTMSFTSLKYNSSFIKLALGAADVSGNKVTPRRDLKLTDFTDEVWWVGDKADGGAAAICLKNALSTGGFSLQTSKNAKGTISATLTGHFSADAQNDVPMEFYDIPKPTTNANPKPGTT